MFMNMHHKHAGYLCHAAGSYVWGIVQTPAELHACSHWQGCSMHAPRCHLTRLALMAVALTCRRAGLKHTGNLPEEDESAVGILYIRSAPVSAFEVGCPNR